MSLFASLLGHCFATTMTPGVVDTHCFSDMWNGAHVRDAHVVTAKGKVVYSGETIYSIADGRIVFVYLNSQGGSGHGTAAAKGEDIDFTMTMRATAESPSEPLQVRWTIGPDFYVVTPPGKSPQRFVRVP